MLCVSISKITAQTKDSLSIGPDQVENVYKGLVQGEIYKTKYFKAVKAAKKLDTIIQRQHRKILEFTAKTADLDQKLADSQMLLISKTLEAERLSNKSCSWVLPAGIGGLAGILTGFLVFK